ncbi:MAG: polysaccharide pyruvyl transferase family protein [Sulfurimonas sp.]|uniref:polysaccharide pyruvyl transferase family protein n=1 Tax=Sulfurimonas sp. TaxID=2022749 RepID=UPI0025D91196|nr:polysaccharide pyruvyl transferase family protein [Sulfurimonas sp.]MCK9491396.1 polysaccharide pyruvyl transferase family protein [Sulfurimonas sp.]
MKILKTLHLASFDGNIGDNANHDGFYKHLKQLEDFKFEIDELEIREFYWKKRFFNESFVDLVNKYDLLIIGGGNYFELWVEDSPTGTSISIELDLLKKINTPIMFNALGVDPGQGVSELNIQKFRNFLDLLIERDDFISIRNDGAKKAIMDYVGEKYLDHIHHTVDAGFFADIPEPSEYYKSKKYIAINVAYDMQDVRFENISYKEFLQTFKRFTDTFLNENENYEIVFIPHIFRDMTFITDLLNILDDETRRRKISVAPLLHGKSSFKEVMSIYRGAQIVLANRFHANICSIGMGKPTVGLVNYRQIRELYAELDSMNFVDISKKSFNNHLKNFLSEEFHKYIINLKSIEKNYSLNQIYLKLWLEQN